MSGKDKRYQMLETRIDNFWERLHRDVQDWKKSLDKVIKDDAATTDEKRNLKRLNHHVEQFIEGWTAIYTSKTVHIRPYLLDKTHWEWDSQSEWEANYDFLKFRAQVIGVLTARWMALRQVIAQCLKEYPHRDQRNDYDQRVGTYYSRLFQALPSETRNQLTPSAPLVFLGNQPALLRLKRKAPAVLCVALGVITKEEHRHAVSIFHEVAHAIFDPLPDFHRELECRINNHFLKNWGSHTGRRKEVIHQTIVGWLGEIVAYFGGTALMMKKIDQNEAAKVSEYVEHILWLSITTDPLVGVTDPKHPPIPIIPYIYLEAARLIIASPQADDMFSTFERKIEDEYGFSDLLKRRFESLPGLSYVSLHEMKEYMCELIQFVLDQNTKLETLQNTSLLDVLKKCVTKRPKSRNQRLDQELSDHWGELTDEEIREFFLDFPDNLVSYQNIYLELCCYVFGVPSCCALLHNRAF